MPSKDSLQITDPVLNNFSLQFANQGQVATSGSGFGFVGSFIAPDIQIGNNNTFKYFTYNEGNLFQNAGLDARRGKGAEYPSLDWDVSSDTGIIEDRGFLSEWDDTEQTEQIRPVDLNRDCAENATQNLLLDKEIDIVTKAIAATIPTATAAALSGGAGVAWDGAGSDPFQDMLAMIDIIYLACGRRPNRAVFGWSVWKTIANHDEIVARLNAANNPAGLQDVTPQRVGSLLNVDLRVADALKNSAKEGQTVSKTPVYDKEIILFFNNPATRIKSLSFMKNFQKRGLETRRTKVVLQKRNTVDVSHEAIPKRITTTAAYRLTSVVS